MREKMSVGKLGQKTSRRDWWKTAH